MRGAWAPSMPARKAQRRSDQVRYAPPAASAFFSPEDCMTKTFLDHWRMLSAVIELRYLG